MRRILIVLILITSASACKKQETPVDVTTTSETAAETDAVNPSTADPAATTIVETAPPLSTGVTATSSTPSNSPATSSAVYATTPSTGPVPPAPTIATSNITPSYGMSPGSPPLPIEYRGVHIQADLLARFPRLRQMVENAGATVGGEFGSDLQSPPTLVISFGRSANLRDLRAAVSAARALVSQDEYGAIDLSYGVDDDHYDGAVLLGTNYGNKVRKVRLADVEGVLQSASNLHEFRMAVFPSPQD